MSDSVSIYSKGLLAESFRAVRRPWWHPAVRGPKNGDGSITVPVKGIPLKVAFPTGTWRSLTLGWRYAFAAWKWLQPNDPCRTLEELPLVQEAAGLDHVDRQTFAAQLIETCKEAIRLHPLLRRWIEYRIASLDYWADPPKQVDQRLLDHAVTLRNGLWRAHYLVLHDPVREESKVTDGLEQAMQAAAISVTQALGIEGCSRVSANLMVPLSQTEVFQPNEGATLPAKNWEAAAELWAGLDASRRLVVVAETEGSTHRGFWIPLVYGEGGSVLPGAPTAYVHLEGDVVFKDDLPPLRAFGEKVEARWRSYMVDRFRQKLFVSVPFRAPNGSGGYIAPAVLNVNADADDLSHWKRAYHREWLAVARQNVQPFVELALCGWLVMLNLRAPAARLDTGSEAWDTFPTVGPHLLPGRST